jgi:hypothetical protein
MTRRLLLALALLAGGCQCGSHGNGAGGSGNGSGLVGVQGIGQASNLAFGNVLVGQSTNLNLTLLNSGSEPLTVESVDLGGPNAADFTLAAAAPRNALASGVSVAIPVRFAPSAEGARSATITLNTDSAATPNVVVQVSGTGVEFGFSAAPSPVAFGSVQLGAPPPTQTLVLSNGGNLNLTVTLGGLAGPDASLFTLAGGGGPLAPGASRNVVVTFTPTTIGADAATLPIQVCATGAASGVGCGSASIQLTATAVDSLLAFNPNPLTFGTVPASSSSQLALTILNPGTADVTLTQLVTQSGSTAVFALQALPGTFPATPIDLPAGQSLQLTVQYTPSGSPAGDTDTLVASYTDSGSVNRTADLPLYGNVVLTPCSLGLSPTSLAFGTVQVGTLATANLALSNSGQAACQITNLALAASSDPDFSLPAGTPSSFQVPGLASVQLGVDFLSPTAVAPLLRTGTLTFQSTDPNQPNLTVPLSATLNSADFPCTLSIQPASLAFGTLAANVQSAQQVTLTNSGVSVCTVTAIALSSATDPDFTLATPAQTSLTIAAGASATIGVDFEGAATAPLSHTGDLLFQTSDQTQPNVDIPLTAAIGAPCQLTIAPASLNFGTDAVGSSTTLAVTVTNGSLATCNVTGVALSAATDPDFALGATTQTNFALAPGAFGTLGVVFAPTSAKSPFTHNGDLLFATTDATNATVDIPLVGQVPNNTPYAGGWPKWHNDNTDQGQSAADTSKNVGTLIWKFEVGAPTVGPGIAGEWDPNPTYMNSPVIDGAGNVYQLGASGTFYGVGADGGQLWTANLLAPNPDAHPATPIIAADGTIFVETGTDDTANSVTAQLYHLDPTTGAILFQAGPPTGAGTYGATADGFDVCPSIGQDGLLFDGDDFGQIVTYTRSGTSFTQTGEANLPFSGERVAVALDQSNNSYWCSFGVCFAVNSPASTAGFTQMAAWPSTGAPIGNVAASSSGSWVNSDVAYDESFTGWLMVEAGIQTGSVGTTTVAALSLTNGAVQWQVSLPSGPTLGSYESPVGLLSSDVGNSAPAVDAIDGTVYVGNVNGLYAFVGKTGVIKTGFPYLPSQDTGADADVDSAPAIGGDRTVFFGTAGGTFYAINPDGSERYHYKTGGRISSSPAIAPDGTVVFVSDDGYMYKLK